MRRIAFIFVCLTSYFPLRSCDFREKSKLRIGVRQAVIPSEALAGFLLALKLSSGLRIRGHGKRALAMSDAIATQLRPKPSRVSAPPLSSDMSSGLKLLNSLSQKKEAFVPIDPRLVKWYICGPTVYDAAHIGHARNYIAFDIVRRVLMEYFGFDIFYVMNITDIDDKIILRTHFNHLKAMVARIREQIDSHAPASEKSPAELSLHAAHAAADETLALAKPGLPDLLKAQRDLASAAKSAGIEDVEVCDVQSEFLKLTTAYELDFFSDMEALGVMAPDAVTRVSDYVPEIISYIEKIIANGYGYEAGGSVYFDSQAFSQDPSKSYGKLDPTRVIEEFEEQPDWTEGKTVEELLAEGEGALTDEGKSDKKQVADFVLWKASKEGEPAWDSPWGMGRPGWHIECSTMASDLLGDKIDFNAGGIDLKFPHHENQICQAEAHFNCCAGESWVNYFLHSGHLQIEGLKMSKSLKNFITIKGALSEYSPNQIRFLFLMRGFSEPMEYSENTMRTAVDLERRFTSFSTSLNSRLNECMEATTPLSSETSFKSDDDTPPLPKRAASHKWEKEERELQEVFVAKRREVHQALCDSIDTATALKVLEQLVRATNKYMQEVPDVTRGGTLLTSISEYFSKIMLAFGATSWNAGRAAQRQDASGDTASTGALAEALSQFRDQLRQMAIEKMKESSSSSDTINMAKTILGMCDALRDETLPKLGVQLDDRASGVAQVTVGDPKVLMAEAARKAEEAAAANAAKEAKKAAKAALAALEEKRGKVPPLEFFDPKHDELFEREVRYGARDEEGIPIEDANGEPLSKSARKKLVKQLNKHIKLYSSA